MKRSTISAFCLCMFLSLQIVISTPVQAQAPSWDFVGIYTGFYEVQDGYNPFDMVIQNEDFTDGNFTGTMNGFELSGQSSGDSLTMSVPISDGIVFNGTVASDGTLAGGMVENNGHGLWYGGWVTLTGNAAPISPGTPEPDAVGLLTGLGISCTCLLILRRRSRHLSLASRDRL